MTRFAAAVACYALAAASAGAGVNAALMQRAIQRAMQPQAARPTQLLRLVERPRKCAVPLLRAPLDYSSAVPLKRAPLRDPGRRDGGVRLPLPSCGDETRTVRHVQ